MTIEEADKKGLLQVGVKIRRTYKDGDIIEGIITKNMKDLIYVDISYSNQGSTGGWNMYKDSSDGTIEILNSKNTMSLQEKFILALTKEPNKSFRKANVTNGDDLLTEEGTVVFLSWLLHSKYADEFKKEVVDDMLKEKE